MDTDQRGVGVQGRSDRSKKRTFCDLYKERDPETKTTKETDLTTEVVKNIDRRRKVGPGWKSIVHVVLVRNLISPL